MNDKGKDGLVNAKLLNNKRFRYEQAKVFIITVLLYCTWHASRTAWAYSKKGVKGSNSYFTDSKLGVLDMCFMLAYAFGQFYNGWLGDQSELKIFLAIGTVISLLGYFLFALLARIEAYNLLIFSICFLLYGFGQSRGFPGSTAILGNWIEASRRGMLLGVWNATSDNVGNIMGQQISRIMIEVYGLHWSSALFLTGATMIGLTVVLFLYLKVHPNQAGFGLGGLSHHEEMREVEIKTNIHTHQDVDSDYVAVDHQTGALSQGIGFMSALKTPGIIKYALVYACIKGSIYGLLFWLPDYLHSVMGFGQDTAFIAAAYEIGQFIGAVGLGYITDRLGKRSVGLVVSLYVSALVFVILAIFGSGATVSFFAVILFFAGIFIGGPQVIVGSVVSSDLGEKNSMNSDVRSISTLAGIVNGTGSIAAALIQVIIPLLKSVSFFVYFGLCLCAAILLTSTAIEDIKAQSSTQNMLLIPEETELELRRGGSSRGSLH